MILTLGLSPFRVAQLEQLTGRERVKMAERGVSLTPLKWLGLVATVIALTNIAIFLDIPVLRQVFGFIFLTFVPGFLLLSILKLNKLGMVEKIVLSTGLSFAFLMFFGLLVNGLLLALGYTKPLSTVSLLTSFSTATIVLAIVAFMRNKGIAISLSDFKLTTGGKAFLIVPALFPLLSILGMRLMNLTNNNVMLMVLLLLIPVYVIFISFSHRRVSEKVYPVAIFLISISLLLMYSLRTNHIIGSDIHREYFIFVTTWDNLFWSKLGFGALDTSLSISILPAIYQTFLNIDPEYLYKLFPSVIVSILPLAVYLLSKKYIGSFYAFLTSVFFMSQIVFLLTPTYVRVNIAIFFFGLAIFVLFDDNIRESSKRALFIIFAASTIVSHYGVTYVAFFIWLFTWIGMEILPRIIPRHQESEAIDSGSRAINNDPPALPLPRESPSGSTLTDRVSALELTQTEPSRGITIAFLFLFLAMLFFWYSQMGGPTFAYGVRFVYNSFVDWQWFLGKGVAEQPVQAAFGLLLPYAGIAQRIEFVFSWLTIILISFGVLTVLVRFRAMVLIPFIEHRQANFWLKRLELEYVILSIACFLLLVTMTVLPYLSRNYGSARTYFQMMAPLSVFFIIGGIEAAKYLKSRPYWVILVVLIPYFLSTTSVVAQVSGYQRAITLNPGGISDGSTSDAESYAAKWVKEYTEEGTTIYTHGFTRNILLSQGKIPGYGIIGSRISDIELGKEMNGYIYLIRAELGEGGVVVGNPGVFAGNNKIYSNGDSEVHQTNPR